MDQLVLKEKMCHYYVNDKMCLQSRQNKYGMFSLDVQVKKIWRLMHYGAKNASVEVVINILMEDGPPVEVLTLRKKLLRYTKSRTEMDREKYENDLHYIKQKEEKMQGRDKRVGKRYLQEQKRKEMASLAAKMSQSRK